jgi:predicted DNA-binding transcriptional regulator AlpA
METLINEKQLSEKLQLSLACLRRWRLCGTGPLYIKVGPLVRYRPEDIETWMADLPRGGEGRRPVAPATVRKSAQLSA